MEIIIIVSTSNSMIVDLRILECACLHDLPQKKLYEAKSRNNMGKSMASMPITVHVVDQFCRQIGLVQT